MENNNELKQSIWKKLLTNKALICLCVSVLLIIVGAIVASSTQTIGGTYKIFTEKIEYEPVTSNAIVNYQNTGVKSTSVADFYIPKKASSSNKVPLIFVVPGIQRTKETQASFCIELARRGAAVICLDPSAQGESSTSYESQAATQEGYGLYAWMDNLFEEDGVTLKEEFDYIDKTRIGACGHSAGGNACQKFAEREGKISLDKGSEYLVSQGFPLGCRVNSVYITGYIRDWTWKTSKCNVGISYSQADEGAFQNKTAQKKAAMDEEMKNGSKVLSDYTELEQNQYNNGVADLRYAEESLTIVNYQMNRYYAANGSSDVSALKEVEIGEDYGNPYQGNYAIINNENCLHAFQPYDKPTLVHLVTFFNYVFELDTDIADTNVNYWWGKEIGSGLTLLGGFILMFAILPLLLQIPFFKSLKHEIPERTGDQKVKGRICFWITFVIGAILACYLYMVAVEKSTEWFATAYKGIQTWQFPQRFTNAVMLWAVINGIIGVAMFFITYGIEWFIDVLKAKKANPSEEELVKLKEEIKANYVSKLEPMKISSPLNLLKGLLLSAIIILSFYGCDYLIYLIFHVDFRFMFVNARTTFNVNIIKATIMYLPFFFIFYLSNSFRVNCAMRPSNWPEWLSQIIALLGNTLGLVAILFFEYGTVKSTGMIGYTSTVGPQWLFVNLLFGIIPMMALLPIVNRYYFNKTNNQSRWHN